MCIRDRLLAVNPNGFRKLPFEIVAGLLIVQVPVTPAGSVCLLYTSDAADERSSVDLGGRRIIKKKKIITRSTMRTMQMYKQSPTICYIHHAEHS